MIEKEIKKHDGSKRQMRNGGLFSTKEKRVIPGPRYATSGNVTMATNGATYRFPNPYGATQVMFYGIASRNPGSVDIRVDVFGVAQLRPSYYFEPQSTTEVAVAKQVQKIIQSGKWFLIVDENVLGTTPEYRARAIETTLTNIDWPTANDIVVRAEVIDYGPDWFDVKVDLATNWTLVGNFVCT
ncbi:hypothetical protein [Caudoviricetes sp.]|nr:hypothetical protein [Caudoviricetes sp.]